MKMNRTRFNHMRNDRDNDGLPQVLQVAGPPTGVAMGTLTAVRKTTYTRTELMQRTPNGELASETFEHYFQTSSTSFWSKSGQIEMSFSLAALVLCFFGLSSALRYAVKSGF